MKKNILAALCVAATFGAAQCADNNEDNNKGTQALAAAQNILDSAGTFLVNACDSVRRYNLRVNDPEAWLRETFSDAEKPLPDYETSKAWRKLNNNEALSPKEEALIANITDARNKTAQAYSRHTARLLDFTSLLKDHHADRQDPDAATILTLKIADALNPLDLSRYGGPAPHDNATTTLTNVDDNEASDDNEEN